MAVYIRDYPRPQFVRRQWKNLNGAWRFAFDDENEGLAGGWSHGLPGEQTIRVPFSYETEMSGIGDERVHNVVWYSREVSLAEWDRESRLLLHFEGCDYRTQVWANGAYIGEHRGGYARFSFDLTHAAAGAEGLILTVRVEDGLAQNQPRGKQRYKNESWGCWYVQTTGIWKTVWMECVPREYLLGVANTPDPEQGLLRLEVEAAIEAPAFAKADYVLETRVCFDGVQLVLDRQPLTAPEQEFTVSLRQEEAPLHLWSPEQPSLYDVRYRLYRNGLLLDTAESYFGLRHIELRGDRILLNGSELYLRMILDQGYWQRSGLTPPDEAALTADIELARRFGYNGVRKHQKIEDERWLYWCDVKGMLVWSEMAACYAFDGKAVESFTREWTEAVRQNKNHPCIMTWVPFNESWGVPEIRQDPAQQAFVNGIYYLTKALDGTRPVVTNDGWEHTLSDILTIHDYKEYGEELYSAYGDGEQAVLNNRRSVSWYGQRAFAGGYGYRGQPVILSEYGGIAVQSADGWGYGRQVRDAEAFLERFGSQNDAIHRVPYFTGFCYTQLTDVQQEINGLVDMARQDKFSADTAARIREINLRTGKK